VHIERRNAWVVWGLIVICAIVLAPLLPSVMLALWLSSFAEPVHRPLTRLLGGRVRLAATVTVAGLSAILIPFLLMLASLAFDAYDLVVELLDSQRGKEVLERLVAAETPAEPGTSSLWDLLLLHKERSWAIALELAGTATRVVVSLVVILAGTYAVLVDGRSWFAWLERHAPVTPRMLHALRDAFYETGRGLFIGIGGAGLLQSIVATIAYLVLDVPRPLELGLLTFCFSIIPAVGTAIVWVPISAGLLLTGRTEAAIAMFACGLLVIGTIDNVVRPVLARWGRLQLPTYVVLVSMFAGMLVLGTWGLFLAPLAVRLARAAIETSAGGA
jgi:predicted PurR-regulated permease PerM